MVKQSLPTARSEDVLTTAAERSSTMQFCKAAVHDGVCQASATDFMVDGRLFSSLIELQWWSAFGRHTICLHFFFHPNSNRFMLPLIVSVPTPRTVSSRCSTRKAESPRQRTLAKFSPSVSA
jgi:hypothetical protein